MAAFSSSRQVPRCHLFGIDEAELLLESEPYGAIGFTEIKGYLNVLKDVA